MKLQNRIKLFIKLGEYLQKNPPEWQNIKKTAFHKNGWFTEDFIQRATDNIIEKFLDQALLEEWASQYQRENSQDSKCIGIVMAGNIPLVGFHDFLSVFISGHHACIKLSSKDDVLLPFLISKLKSLDAAAEKRISLAESLKNCDAYIATGGNQSSTYFEQYFSKYPHIIRKNKTSVAILSGEESQEDLKKLADDIHLYFGLGCRNVTKIFVPVNYDFIPLLQAFKGYDYFRDHHKYSNNYDYQLSILLLNHQYYMSSECTLLVESEELFSPISVLNYSFYDNKKNILEILEKQNNLQCIISSNKTAFGLSQTPGLFDYADGVDTMQFLQSV